VRPGGVRVHQRVPPLRLRAAGAGRGAGGGGGAGVRPTLGPLRPINGPKMRKKRNVAALAAPSTAGAPNTPWHCHPRPPPRPSLRAPSVTVTVHELVLVELKGVCPLKRLRFQCLWAQGAAWAGAGRGESCILVSL